MCPLFWITKTLIMIVALWLYFFVAIHDTPHAYEQNKAFTKHIVDAMMKALEEKLSRIDDLSRSVDRIAHDVDNLKMKICVPKVHELIKALYVSMDESKKRTAMLRAKREFLEKAFSSDFFCKSDEDIKMLVSHTLNLCSAI